MFFLLILLFLIILFIISDVFFQKPTISSETIGRSRKSIVDEDEDEDGKGTGLIQSSGKRFRQSVLNDSDEDQ